MIRPKADSYTLATASSRIYNIGERVFKAANIPNQSLDYESSKTCYHRNGDTRISEGKSGSEPN